MGQAAEAAVYSYIGLSLYSQIPGWWSFKFIIWQTVLIVLGRYTAIYLVFRVCCHRGKTRELAFIGWAGMIRGAIAYALVMKIPHHDSQSCPGNTDSCYTRDTYDLVVSTCLVVVFLTTFVFGNFM